MTAVAQKPLTAGDLARAIRKRYEPPEWHLESEVTLAGRRLDVVALNLWGARQWRIVGFEIKVSRGDWLRELGAFRKSEEWTAVVDAFYVVTTPKLVRDGELPEGWGLLELTGSRMMTRRHATTREGRTTIPREVAARFINALAERARQADLGAEYRAREALRKEVREEFERLEGNDVQKTRERLRELEQEHNELLRALDVEPLQWSRHKAAMRAAGIFAKATTTGATLRNLLDANADRLDALVKQLREASAQLFEEAPL